MRLGRTASPLDHRTLVHARYRLPGVLPQFPPSEDWASAGAPYAMSRNDELGNCGPVGLAHAVQTWTAAAGGRVVLPQAGIDQCYHDVGGYVEGDPSTDCGVCLLDLLKYAQGTGIGGHKIGPFCRLDPTNSTEMAEAHHMYVGVMLGLDLPQAWQNPGTWDVGPNMVGDWSPGSWGGHCVVGERYALTVGVVDEGMLVVTWGELQLITWPALARYCSEAYGILSTDYMHDGKSPIGLDWSTLQADFEAVQTMSKAAPIAYKAVPMPVHSMMVDTTLRITAANAAAFKTSGRVVAVARYLGGLSPQEVSDITGTGLGVLLLNYSRRNGWLPSAALGVQDAARDIGQARALSAPAGATLVFDCEGCGANPRDHIAAWATGVTAAGYIAGCYADGQDKMSGVEFGAIPNLTRYWNGAAVGTAEPLYRGWCATQHRPCNDHLCGVLVDFSSIYADSRGGTPTMMVRAA